MIPRRSPIRKAEQLEWLAKAQNLPRVESCVERWRARDVFDVGAPRSVSGSGADGGATSSPVTDSEELAGSTKRPGDADREYAQSVVEHDGVAEHRPSTRGRMR
jgi:hypothetical protein